MEMCEIVDTFKLKLRETNIITPNDVSIIKTFILYHISFKTRIYSTFEMTPSGRNTIEQFSTWEKID